ncbi:MAG: protein kinase [bacterium]
MIGKSLAHYTITAHLGTGGMGEVWRARDGKLGRDVALKVLPQAVARDPERLARFQREAFLLASLNHPGIAAIYGLEQVDQTPVLVLELVDGPTLADRLAAGPFPVAEALPIALQIAEAVEAAHEKGIVHRDLKPANVKLTAEGRVKVLDFGLAKALVDDPASSASGSGARGDLQNSPTMSPAMGSLTSPAITGAMTGINVILGTAAYMAPEQARGQSVDRRADIWAMGVILYEMLTGRRLFTGETISDTLASVLKTDPDWSALPEETPPRVRRLLRRCLERNPKERLRDAGDARLLLREAIAGAPEETASLLGMAPAAAAPRRSWVVPVTALVSAAIAAGAVWTLAPRQSAAPPLRKFVFPIAGTARLENLALAPDGSALAYTHEGRIEIREFRTGEIRALAGTDGAVTLCWSPDGAWIAYGTPADLKKVRRTGGDPVLVASLHKQEQMDPAGGGSWDADDRIVFASGSGGLYAVPAQGGDPQTIASPGKDESDFHKACSLPGGRGWLVVVHRSQGYDTIAGFDAKGGRHPVLTLPGQSLFDVTWSSSGHVLFRRAGSAEGIWAFPFSPEQWKATGEPFLVAAGCLSPAAALDASVAYVRGRVSRTSKLALVDRTGKIEHTLGEPGEYRHFPALSPDGREVVCPMVEGETRNLWIVDVDRGTRRRLTEGEKEQSWPIWSVDGRDVWYSTGDPVHGTIEVRAASGAGAAREVTPGIAPAFAWGGKRLFFTRLKDGSFDFDLWTLDLERQGAAPEVFLGTDKQEYGGVASPTDPLVAYTCDASGKGEVYLATFPKITGTWLVSSGGGDWPKWRRDGRELYYVAGDSVLAATVDPGGGADVHLGAPRLLFRRPQYRQSYGSTYDSYDATPDGQHFLINVADEEAGDPPALIVVQNWLEEFRKAKS